MKDEAVLQSGLFSESLATRLCRIGQLASYLATVYYGPEFERSVYRDAFSNDDDYELAEWLMKEVQDRLRGSD